MVLPFVFLVENKDTFTFDFDLKKRQNTEGPPKKVSMQMENLFDENN
jgi:hypothetical protein